MRNVILKADDFHMESITESWRCFLSYCVDENVYCNVGVIAGSSANLPPAQCVDVAAELVALGMRARWSLWNHGLVHKREQSLGTSDFRGTPLERQLGDLRSAQDVVERVAGVRMTAFGSPFNWWDHNTIIALQQVEEIRYVFHIPYIPGKICYGSELFVQCEPFLGEVRPGAARVFSIEQAKRRSERFLDLDRTFVLQVHPNSWEEGALDNFAAFVEYLKEADYRFRPVDERCPLSRPPLSGVQHHR